ncbi:MAG: hypothetical protein WC702_00215 [Patescibacteria group bacterium]
MDIFLTHSTTIGRTYPYLGRAFLGLNKARQANQAVTDPRVPYLELVGELRRIYGTISFEQAHRWILHTDSLKDIEERRRVLLRRDVLTDFAVADVEFWLPFGHPKAKLTVATRSSIILVEHHISWINEGVEAGWLPRPRTI